MWYSFRPYVPVAKRRAQAAREVEKRRKKGQTITPGVMDVVTEHGAGLFPKPGEIKLRCSCPDWAGMCKHIAAVLYGVGARLDREPELLFRLRNVDHLQLIEEAVPQAGKQTATGKKTL